MFILDAAAAVGIGLLVLGYGDKRVTIGAGIIMVILGALKVI